MSTTLVELAKRLPARLSRWVPQLLAAELCFGVDPFWMAAILEQESKGGDALKPKGPAGKGDGGHGHGLGQIDDRSHMSFLAAQFDDGKQIWTDPTFNVLYGARLLRKNLDLCGQDYFVAVAGYNCGLSRAKAAVRALGPNATVDQQLRALDAKTARGSYLSRVIAIRDGFFSACLPA